MYVLFSVQYCNILNISLHGIKKDQVFFHHLYRFNFISGVCFYGKTAERVLSILATGNHRTLFPPGKALDVQVIINYSFTNSLD